jgi:hypothetical protein
MAPKGIRIDRFPGLDLRQDVTEWPGAVDCLNVEFVPGRIRTRPGTTVEWTGTAAPFLFTHGNLEGVIVVSTSAFSDLRAIRSGVTIATTTAPASSPYRFSAAAIGTPTAAYVYVQAGSAIRRWEEDTDTWSTPAGMPANPGTLTTTAADNRLVVCDDSESKVWFSDPGAPETFGANNYVQLRPGDGEGIGGAAVYNNQTFVFKRSKFFVFYGQSTDSTGEPVFNYRVVDGVGLGVSQSQGVCTGADGVYFIGHDGIYRTTGGVPTRISDPLRPFFASLQELPPYWQGSAWVQSSQYQCLAWHDGCLYAVVSRLVGTPALIVFDPTTNAWSWWEIGALTVAAPSPADSGNRDLLFGTLTGISRLDRDKTVDGASTAIVSRYRSGFMDLGDAGKKTIRETIVEGIGAPRLQWSSDYGALNTGSIVTLGTSPAESTSRQSYAVQGRRFSYQVGASSGAWAVNYLQPNVLAERPAYVT